MVWYFLTSLSNVPGKDEWMCIIACFSAVQAVIIQMLCLKTPKESNSSRIGRWHEIPNVCTCESNNFQKLESCKRSSVVQGQQQHMEICGFWSQNCFEPGSRSLRYATALTPHGHQNAGLIKHLVGHCEIQKLDYMGIWPDRACSSYILLVFLCTHLAAIFIEHIRIYFISFHVILHCILLNRAQS